MIFIDASFFLAYYNINDIHHNHATKLWNDIETEKYGIYFTSDYIFNEVIGVTLRKSGKKNALIIGQHILKSIIILNIDDHILSESWNLFSKTNLNFNLVDCSILTALKLINAKYLATFDKEFNKLKEIKVIE